MKIFIGGSIGITQLPDEILGEFWVRCLYDQHQILVGDAPGVDTAIQTQAFEKQYPKVTIYYSGVKCRNNCGNFETQQIQVQDGTKGREFYGAKDQAMVNDADVGLLIWDGQSAGTIHNAFRVLLQRKSCYFIVCDPMKQQFTSYPELNFEDLVGILNRIPRNQPSYRRSVLRRIDIKIGLLGLLKELYQLQYNETNTHKPLSNNTTLMPIYFAVRSWIRDFNPPVSPGSVRKGQQFTTTIPWPMLMANSNVTLNDILNNVYQF